MCSLNLWMPTSKVAVEIKSLADRWDSVNDCRCFSRAWRLFLQGWSQESNGRDAWIGTLQLRFLYVHLQGGVGHSWSLSTRLETGRCPAARDQSAKGWYVHSKNLWCMWCQSPTWTYHCILLRENSHMSQTVQMFKMARMLQELFFFLIKKPRFCCFNS